MSRGAQLLGSGFPIGARSIPVGTRFSDNILFIDASKEFEKGKDQNILRDQDIEKIVKTYEERKDVEKYAHVATMDEIIENGYNLNIPRYVNTANDVEEIDFAKVTAEMEETDKEIAKVSEDLKASFAELGLQFPF